MNKNSMECCFESDMKDYRKDDRDHSHSAEHPRSMSDSAWRRWTHIPILLYVVVAIPRCTQQDRMGVVWAKNAYIDGNSLPTDDREFRAYVASCFNDPRLRGP